MKTAPESLAAWPRVESTMSLSELREHLERIHHVETRSALLRLQEQIKLLFGCDQAQRAVFRQIGTAFIAFRDLLEAHLQEEVALFSSLPGCARDGAGELVCTGLQRMRHDHNAVEEGLSDLQELIESARQQWPECASIRRAEVELEHVSCRLHEQIYEEDHILYRRAQVLRRPQ